MQEEKTAEARSKIEVEGQSGAFLGLRVGGFS
jgi:hypothetical protein